MSRSSTNRASRRGDSAQRRRLRRAAASSADFVTSPEVLDVERLAVVDAFRAQLAARLVVSVGARLRQGGALRAGARGVAADLRSHVPPAGTSAAPRAGAADPLETSVRIYDNAGGL